MKIQTIIGFLFLVIMVFAALGLVQYIETQETIKENLRNSISLPEGSDTIGFGYTEHDDGWYYCEIMVEKPVRVCSNEEKQFEPWKCKDISVMQAWCDYWCNLDTNKTYQVAGTFNSSNGIAWWDEK